MPSASVDGATVSTALSAGRAGRRDVAPVRAAVARQVDETVVGSGPNLTFVARGCLDVENRSVVLRAGLVLSHRILRRLAASTCRSA